MQIPASRHPIQATLATLFLTALLAACGGGDGGSRLDNGNGNGNGVTNGNGEGPGNGNGNGTTASAQLGRGSGADFVNGEIEVGIPEGSTLTAGGSTSLTVTLVNSSGDLLTEPATISFGSECLSSGAATLANTDEDDGNSVTTNTGRAMVTYRANGCVGEDRIVASAASDGRSDINTASASLFVDQDTLDQVQYWDTTPSVIGIRGMGSQETTAEVRFRIVGENGSPIRDVDVDFALLNPPAGASLASDTATSNSEGYVTARVRSGSGAGVVNVTATAEGTSTMSRDLVITTTTPTQRHSTLSVEEPILNAWNTDGIETEVTMRLGDQNNNHVPEGTRVYFTASAGVIDGSCATNEDSACSVTWRSQGDRPRGSGGVQLHTTPQPPNDTLHTCPGDAECRGGRVVLMATTEGNESFMDINNNGVFDPETDLFATEGDCDRSSPRSYIPPAPIEEACDDLGPAYLDTNFNGQLDDDERVLDEREANGIYNGVLCRQEDHDAGRCSRDPITIRKDNMLVLASHRPFMPVPGLPASITIGTDQTRIYRITIADHNGNGMPAGTELEVMDDLASNVDFELSDDTLGASTEPTGISLQVTSDENDTAFGEIRFRISSGGNVTTIGPIEINPE